MPNTQQQEHGRGPEYIPADWGKEVEKQKPAKAETEKKTTTKEKKPWSIEAGQAELSFLTNQIKKTQDSDSPKVEVWKKSLRNALEMQLKNCVAEYSKAKSLVEVANHIKDLETTGAAYLGEDMDEVYEKLKIKDEIEGIKNEAEAKQKLEKMLTAKKDLQNMSEKLLAEADKQITPKKRKMAEEGRHLAQEALAGKPVAEKTTPELPSNEEMANQNVSWFGKMLRKIGLFKTVAEGEQEREAKGERYALKLEEKAAQRESKKEARQATKRLKMAYKETAEADKIKATEESFQKNIDKQTARVLSAEEKRQEKAAEKKVNKMIKSYKTPKASDQDEYLAYTQKPSRAQKIIEQQKNYPEMRGKAFELPAQAADYLKDAGLPEALIDTATSRMKELRLDAKAHGMGEQTINEITQNFLTGITQKYKENPRLFGKKPPSSYEVRKMEELINKVEKETREKAA
jgi:hypothetical protein